jgi:hypothetical protein
MASFFSNELFGLWTAIYPSGSLLARIPELQSGDVRNGSDASTGKLRAAKFEQTVYLSLLLKVKLIVCPGTVRMDTPSLPSL